MKNLRPIAFLSLPILGTLMLLNFAVIKPYAKANMIKNIKINQLLIAKK